MNVFLPYQSPIECAKALYGDKRFNKQILECRQILDAIDGKKAWKSHPCTLMYKPYRKWLSYYMDCLYFYREHRNYGMSISAAENYSKLSDSMRPPFLTEKFCNQHKRRLFTKAPYLYPQFAEYGTSEENWYVIGNEIVKYVNGKRIKE